MLAKLEQRKDRLGISLRSLAAELGISPTLLSLVMNGRRKPSKGLSTAIRRWFSQAYRHKPSQCPKHDIRSIYR